MNIFKWFRRKKLDYRIELDEKQHLIDWKVMDINDLNGDGSYKELKPDEWMGKEDIINLLDPGRVQCPVCFKYINKRDAHPIWNSCTDSIQCQQNLTIHPIVKVD